jgi:hypothetical protein
MFRKLILVLAGWALATTAQAQLHFGGYFVLAREEFVALSVPNARTVWVKVGDVYGDYRILRLDRSEKKLYVKLGDEELTVPMSERKILYEESKPQRVRLPDPVTNGTGPVKPSTVFSRFPATDIGARSNEGLDWAWIDSDKNPMKKLPIQPSISEQDAWPSLSESEKEDLVELYRQHGWHIAVELNEAGVGVRYRKAKPSTEQKTKP